MRTFGGDTLAEVQGRGILNCAAHGNLPAFGFINEAGEWEYFSRNVKTGKTVRINMEEMIRDIEQLTGKTYIKDE